jgi:FkbM family methyltransferase
LSDRKDITRILKVVEKNPARARRVLATKIRNTRATSYYNGIVAMVRPGDVVIDAGANVGVMTENFVQRGATVHAFEPDPVAHAELQKAFGDHELVTIHKCAVGHKKGKAKLYRLDGFSDAPEASTIGSTLLAGNTETHTDSGLSVDVVNLPAFLAPLIKKHKEITLLKLDVEGAELEILETMRDRGMFKNVRYTLVETHVRYRPNDAARFEKLQSYSDENPHLNIDLDWI